MCEICDNGKHLYNDGWDVTMSVNPWEVVRVPFDAVRYAYRQMRKTLFTAPRPSGQYVVVDADVTDIERELGKRSYAPNWEFSYYERGEDLNMARVVYDRRTIDGTTYRWWQTHTRGWENGEGQIELSAHWELEPTENGNEHIDGVGISVESGRENLKRALDDTELEYTEEHIDGSTSHE